MQPCVSLCTPISRCFVMDGTHTHADTQAHAAAHTAVHTVTHTEAHTHTHTTHANAHIVLFSRNEQKHSLLLQPPCLSFFWILLVLHFFLSFHFFSLFHFLY